MGIVILVTLILSSVPSSESTHQFEESLTRPSSQIDESETPISLCIFHELSVDTLFVEGAYGNSWKPSNSRFRDILVSVHKDLVPIEILHFSLAFCRHLVWTGNLWIPCIFMVLQLLLFKL